MSEYLTKSAWQFLLKQDICALPINPLQLCSKNGWIVYTYTQLSDLVHKSVPQLIELYDNDGFVFWSSQKRKYVICYNSAMPSPVCRWTLLHEISHIYLEHVAPHTPTLLRVRTEQRPFFEIEAQGFTRRVLCPSIILHNCKAFEPAEIVLLCGISREAAEYRSVHIKKLEDRGMFCTDPLERQVERRFAAFVRQYHLSKLQNAFQ